MLSKNDYKIMLELYNAGGDTELKSFTIEYIKDLTNLSMSKIRKSIREFIRLGFLKEGAKQHRAKTYYITQLGKKKIEKII